MSKNVAMFVDVANMYYAARGQDVDVDYVALLKHATKGRDLIRAYAYTGLDPENENQRKFIDFLGKNGYKPVIKDIRKFGDGRMKANLDIELVVDLFRLADRMDIAVIVSGDGDFAPAIKALQDTGVRCEVISFRPNTSSDLIAVADEFMDIMKVASISRKEGRAVRDSMSAPEMPAKEVNPEFGFREASPSVAAAALAALKGGGGSDTGRRGRGSAPRQPAAAAVSTDVVDDGVAATASTVVDAPSDSDPDAPRRRRRRGGRGRGRTRRDDDAAPATDAPSEEIGWQEFDDLSQLDGTPLESEFTFEEADAATLAELGLSPETGAEVRPVADAPPPGGAASTSAVEVDAEPAAKPVRRRGSRTAKRDAGAAPATDAVGGDGPVDAATDATDAPKSPRRRSARAKQPMDEVADATDASDAAAAKPARSRATRAKKDDIAAASTEATKPSRRRAPSASKADPEVAAPPSPDAAPADADGEPQGIWGRFRSARKPRGTEG